MKDNRYCIIDSIDMDEDNPSINDFVKVFYINKYIDKYSKIIDKDKIYSLEEATEILKINSTFGFILCTNNQYNKGSDMIEELAYLEERAELNFAILDWNTFEDFIKSLKEEGYICEKITENELQKWLQKKRKRSLK